MSRLEELTVGACVRGVSPSGLVTIVNAKWIGDDVIELVHRNASGKLSEEVLYRDNESNLEIAPEGRPWTFDGDAASFRLVSEAYRIRLAHLFDPLLAVNTSLVDPLPHQITAVYQDLLSRQPLRFLLADDPGAGKTIMAGLFIKELKLRGALQKCMVVCPGGLAEQWQDELYTKFQLPFEILTNEGLHSARTGNWFAENPLAICRLDKLSRNEDLQLQIKEIDWDLIVVDEAHKMSASLNGKNIAYTKRYRLGQNLSEACRHFLLMTATPHNGKEADFQLFMSLLDKDRFEGRCRGNAQPVDTSDMMRRMLKENIVTFDNTPLFPERRPYTLSYDLSPMEANLYEQVTEYVRHEFNRADRLQDGGRRGVIGFALTILQRRLASSPEAIYQSLVHRRHKLEDRLDEAKNARQTTASCFTAPELDTFANDNAIDSEEFPTGNWEETEDHLAHQVTAAATIGELVAEIETLKGLEATADSVRRSRTDTKWEKLSAVLEAHEEMFDTEGQRRKMVIFTEHRATLSYLAERIRTLLGSPDSVVVIHGGTPRDARRKTQEVFANDKEVHILLATDAAGEGINLQCAHLMVNYDLPWNPNRLEQRFGRIHRIGQTEVCHLWNLVASTTREGDVLRRLLEKLETERKALNGAVFDVLGELIQGGEMRDLLVEAIRYGDRPEVRARLHQVVDKKFDRTRIQALMKDRALACDSLDASQVQQVRQEMERAQARRLQPHFIASFFIAAWKHLGGTIQEREHGRYELRKVPRAVCDRALKRGTPLSPKYERITFAKDSIRVQGKAAVFVCPGHPLLDTTIDLVIEQYRELLRQGTTFVDPNDMGESVRVLYYLEHELRDASTDQDGNPRIVSKQLHFVEVDADGNAGKRGYAPYLDYRPLTEEEREHLESHLARAGISRTVEEDARNYAILHLCKDHERDVKARRSEQIDKILAAVRERLTTESTYWKQRAVEFEAQERVGKSPPLNSSKARHRADMLEERLQQREGDLAKERQIASSPPLLVGGALVIPQGLVDRVMGRVTPNDSHDVIERDRIERLAVDAVLDAERRLGRVPREMTHDNPGYDIESEYPDQPGRLLFIEVKGKAEGKETVTVSKTEVLTALNKPDDFVLAIVRIRHDTADAPIYVRRPFENEPDFTAHSINFKMSKLIARGNSPS